MAVTSIEKELAAIKSAVYGEEVRGSIHDAIEKMHDDLDSAVDHQVLVLDDTLSISGRAADAAKTGDLFAPRYSESKTYPKDSIVLYNGALYKSIVDILVPEKWAANHWTKINLIDTIDPSKPYESKVNKPNVNPDGIAGQLLRTNGDGTTEWVEQGLPTDAQTGRAVSDWLNDHPEATTTVQDWSLTYDKFVKGTLGYVTPEMFGAIGDGVSDDTVAVQRALNYTGTPIVIFSKTYKVNVMHARDSALSVRSNAVILFQGGTIKLYNPNMVNVYNVLAISNVENVTVTGKGSIIGDRAEHTGEKLEFGYGIILYNSQNVLIEGISVYDCIGDGICLEGDNTDHAYSEHVVIRNCTCDNNMRNGISVIAAKDVVIEGCVLKNTNGFNPQYGIDCETNSEDDTCTDIIIRNCKFEDNVNGVINCYTHNDDAVIRIYDCIGDGTIGFCPLGSNSHMSAHGCVLTPKQGKDAFGFSANWTSDITIADCTVYCNNSPRSVMMYNYDQTHMNIKVSNLNIMHGNTEFFSLCWDPTEPEYLDVDVKVTNVNQTNIQGVNYIIPNYDSLYNKCTVESNVKLVVLDPFIIPSYNKFIIDRQLDTTANIFLVEGFANGNTVTIQNDGNITHFIRHASVGWTFVRMNDGASGESLDLEAGHQMIGTVNADKKTVIWYIY